MKDVTLVIPGRNCANTIAQCLNAAVPLLNGPLLKEIVFVNDGSTDNTDSVVAQYSVRVVNGKGKGPAAARNLGLKETTTRFVWFIDSDCVVVPDALEILYQHLGESDTIGVGGSYLNSNPDSLLSCLIHEEIILRHRKMSKFVDYLASFNILFRKDMLIELGGFNERFRTAEDAELSYRVRQSGYQIQFDMNSKVGHFHPTDLKAYLVTQFRHGFWRVFLYLAFPSHAGGDSYSGISDHVQPVLAGLTIALFLPALVVPSVWTLAALLNLLIVAAALPTTVELCRQTSSNNYLLYLPLSLVRAYARAGGMIAGAVHSVREILRKRLGDTEEIDAPTP